jgi:hypothetical protein
MTLLGFGPRANAGDEIAPVEGQIVMNGKPLSGGRILLHQDNGQFVGTKTDKEGKFKIDRVLVGKHKITVEHKVVPEKYASEDTSGLQIDVKSQTNSFILELISK